MNWSPLMYSGLSVYLDASSARTTIAAALPSATPEQSYTPRPPTMSGADQIGVPQRRAGLATASPALPARDCVGLRAVQDGHQGVDGQPHLPVRRYLVATVT